MKSDRIARAAEATERAESHINEARNILGFARPINSLGIYVDVGTVRANIEAAQRELTSAFNNLACEWPRPSDYDGA